MIRKLVPVVTGMPLRSATINEIIATINELADAENARSATTPVGDPIASQRQEWPPWKARA